MIQKYPVGIQDFSVIRSEEYLYVDKTEFIHQLVGRGKFYFLSRPRRFGKSLFLSTMEYLFQAKQELFSGLFIEDKWDWSKTNPVIKISFSNIGHKEKGLFAAINDSLDAIARKYEIQLIETINSGKFKELIEKLAIKSGKVVILIDEYDKPIIDYLGTKNENHEIDKALENRDILKSFYSVLKDADAHLRMVFITGVSKFSKVSVFSDLNNLQDLTINRRFGSCCGISQAELAFYFEKELENLDVQKIKTWYNGYSWDLNTKVYNPFSLLNFFWEGCQQYQNYWFETGTPTFLINLSKKQELFDFENVKIEATQLSVFDLENLQLLPLMFQTGYLTLKNYDEENEVYTLDYPNKEVKQSYLAMLANSYIQSPIDTGRVLATQLREILDAGQVEKLQDLLNSLFKSIPYEIWQNENEHFFHAIIHLTFRLLGIYIESQVQTSDGRIDAIVQNNKYIYAFEFKLRSGTAKKALEQIKEKGYLLPYTHLGKICIGVGIKFSKKSKKVESIIWEQF